MEEREEVRELRNAFYEKYFQDLAEAQSGNKITTYVTGYLPSEILLAMDIFPFYPEAHASVGCAFNPAEEVDKLCRSAEIAGISRDLCAFSTCALGSMHAYPETNGGMPRPTFLISSAYTCGIHVLWWELMQHYYQVPHFIIDGPVLCADYEPRHIEFFISQIKELISFLEEQTKSRLDPDRFRRAIELSESASWYFSEILELRKTIPSPISFRQLTVEMFPIVTFPGAEETTNFYRALYEEVREKAERKIGVAPREEFRLIWDNIPIFHDLDLIDYFESQGMVFVYETFFKEYWSKRLDPAHPFESLAKKYLSGWTNRRLERKIEIIEEAVESHAVDGIVVFQNKGCRAYSTGQLDVAMSLQERKGIPHLIFEGNMADPGGHDRNQVREMVDMFKDVLKSRKAGRKNG